MNTLEMITYFCTNRYVDFNKIKNTNFNTILLQIIHIQLCTDTYKHT